LKPPSISAEYSSLRRSRTEARGDSICLMFKPCLKKRKKEKKKKRKKKELLSNTREVLGEIAVMCLCEDGRYNGVGISFR
jgi:hypothetical protein